MNRLTRPRRRELERELTGLPTPPPPDDLLDKIIEEIPADLGSTTPGEPGGPRRRWHATPAFRLAATVAIAAVGVVLAYRVLERPHGEGLVSPAPMDKLAAPKPAEAGRSLPMTRKVTEAPAPGQQPSGDEKLPVRGKTSAGPTGPAEATVPAASTPESLPAARELQRQAPSGAVADQALSSTEGPSSSLKKVNEAAPEVSGGSSSADAAALEETKRERRMAEKTMERLSPRRDARAAAAPTPASAPPPAPAAGTLGARRSQEEARGRGVGADQESEQKAPYFLGIPPKATPPPSTGGTAEPLDQPVGDMFFRPTGVNPFVDTTEDRLSTFALDTDTGSWTLARSYLDRSALPPAAAIRVEEFVNAQTYEDPAPRRSDFTLTAEGAPSPFAPGARYRLLRFAVRARDVAAWQRKPAVLTFVVDVSGSMDRENRLGLVKRALGLLLDELSPDDRVGLVVYGTRGRVLLAHTRDLEAIRDAIDRLVPEGSTNAEEGLRLAYDLADQGYRAGAVNRLVLCSDGVANVGATGPESILARIGAEARRGIELTTVGFGMGNYNDALMEQLADQGDGTYHYVDSLDEARRVFVDNLTGTLQTVAKDAKVQVEFEPGTVERWRLLGYENRDVADRDFRNDRVDAGEVGVGTAVTALYEIRLQEGVRSGARLATLRLRWKSVDAGRVVEAAQSLDDGDLGRSFGRASRDLRVAAVAAELAERLKGSYWARDTGWSELVHAAAGLRRDFPGDDGVAGLVSMVERAAHLAGAGTDGDRQRTLPDEDDGVRPDGD
jgi:Ca-activated chloride channel family protein